MVMNPTKAIQQNGRKLLAVTIVLVIVIGAACIAIWQSETGTFHTALGTYGVNIDAAQGRDTNGELGTWWPGYSAVESAAQNVSLPLGLLIGFTMGLFPLILMYNHLRTAIRRINDLENSISEEVKSQ